MDKVIDDIASRSFIRMFHPKAVAVVGASPTKASEGYSLTRNLVGSEFQRIVYPVNPNRESIQGVKVSPSIT